MNILDNPFNVLGATLRDDRRRIMELAEEKSLLLDEKMIATASGTLTNPRKRLSAEVAWFLGVEPKRIEYIINQLNNKPNSLLEEENLPALAKANLLASGLKYSKDKIEEDDVPEWIVKIAEVFDEIESETVLQLVNEERETSSFPIIKEHNVLETEINNRRQYFGSVIKEALNQLPTEDLVRITTEIVESATDTGHNHAPLLIDDLVDMYEVEVQNFLNEEEQNVDDLLEQIAESSDEGESDENLSEMVDKLIFTVKNWDRIAQPIQVSTKSRGLRHGASQQIAHKVRNLVIHLLNKHQKLDLSRKITAMLQEVFAEVVEVADKIERDNLDLDMLAQREKHHKSVEPIATLCEKILLTIKQYPAEADLQARKLEAEIPKLLANLREDNPSQDAINEGEDIIAFTLMQCGIVYGNETENWKKSVSILETASKYAKDEETKSNLHKNLSIIKKNAAARVFNSQRSSNNPIPIRLIIWGIIILIVIFFANRSQTPTQQPNDQIPTQEPKITFTIPRGGVEPHLSIAEIRWCLREHIRLETMQSLLITDSAISVLFNRNVNTYKNLCYGAVYYEEDMRLATSQVENMRSQIELEVRQIYKP